MKQNLVRLMILVTPAQKAKLEALRSQGTTASGFIRSLIEREFQRKGKGGSENGLKNTR